MIRSFVKRNVYLNQFDKINIFQQNNTPFNISFRLQYSEDKSPTGSLKYKLTLSEPSLFYLSTGLTFEILHFPTEIISLIIINSQQVTIIFLYSIN